MLMLPPMFAFTTRLRATAVAVACVTTAAACDQIAAAQKRRIAEQPTTRRFETRPLDTLWTRTFDDGVEIATPEYVATDGRNIYVGDPGRRSLTALDAASAATRWVIEPRDRSAAVAAPHALTPRRGGGMIVFDADRRDLVAIGPDGNVVRRTAIPNVDAVSGVCELPDSSLLVSVAGSATGLLQISSSGRPMGVRRLPWTDLGRKSGLLGATLLAPTVDGCVGALVFGRGLARYAGGGFEPPRSYVEPTPLVETVVTRREQDGETVVSESLAEHVVAALDLATTASDVLVAFDGRSADRAHVIDVYDLGGTYRSSYRTSRRVDALAATESTLVVLTKLAGRSTIVALRRPPTAPTNAAP